MEGLQPGPGHVGVNLSRRQIRVTQKQLYHAQIGAVVQQVGRKGVTQGVRRKGPLHANLLPIALDAVPKGLPGHGPTLLARKKHGALRQGWPLSAPLLHPAPDPPMGLFPEGDKALLLPLPQDPKRPLP